MTDKRGEICGDFLRPHGRKACLVIFMALFLFGYNSTVAKMQPSYAQQVTAPQQVSGQTPPQVIQSQCPNTGWCSSDVTCEAPHSAQQASDYLIQNLLTDLRGASNTLENWLFNYMNNVMQSAYDAQQWFEAKMMDGWTSFWYYDMLPGLQSMTRQLNVGLAAQAFQMQADADASETMAVSRDIAKHQQQDRNVNGGEKLCVAATLAGGFTRAKAIDRDMRVAWERDILATGLNEKQATVNGKVRTYPGASSRIGSYAQQFINYLNIFCDPNGNSGKNYCRNSTKLSPTLYNADVEPIKYIYDDLTIPMDSADNPKEGQDVATAVYDIINNMLGIPAWSPMTKPVLGSVAGREDWLMRRSYLARYAAIRSVPDLIASWRLPGVGAGSGGKGKTLGQEVGDLRKAVWDSPKNSYTGPQNLAGGYISKDPSYKEIMHAVSIDQFDSGKFALGMITNKNKLQMEKLNLSVFYLMQLRDYYELLERTALTLAVQVSLRDEKKMQMLQKVSEAVPIK